MHYTDLIVMLHLKLLRLDLLLHFRQGRLANYAKHVALVVFVGGLCFYGLDAVEFGDVTACCFRSAPLVLLLATQTMHISEQARREREVLEQRQRHGSRDKEKDEFEGKGKGDGGAADTGDSGMKPHPHVMGAWLRLVCTWLGSYAYFLDAQPRQVSSTSLSPSLLLPYSLSLTD